MNAYILVMAIFFANGQTDASVVDVYQSVKLCRDASAIYGATVSTRPGVAHVWTRCLNAKDLTDTPKKGMLPCGEVDCRKG